MGMVALVLCALCVSLAGLIEGGGETNDTESLYGPHIGSWLPILMAIITPIGFASNGMMAKFLTKRKMDASVMSHGAFSLINLVILIAAIVFWATVEFDAKLFVIGLIGSIINTIGIVCAVNAIATGPAGPASALITVSRILLTVEEAIRFRKIPFVLEFVGLIVGLTGAMVLTIPDVLLKLIRCEYFRKIYS